MEEHHICPYPGLRPFNDDESIFFKGREKNIDTIIELFEKKKFMMLTGASGDGKSSLIYAGVVPHARAGLFKAKYNSWAVADFRPERDPLGNFTRTLLKFFPEYTFETLRQELSFGFSSLINIYKKSALHPDLRSKEYLFGDDKTKRAIKRKASNLLIIADQFEEFFTNAENYHHGVASVESQTVVNLLLETAKIALAEDLPVYVICTMRSDYIGQCAAFRGLPEYIGFSQFFVPRLKRNEILQVIEEPALLNGDKISRRLAERLLNDITEGYDQLPILQHALNQIWKVARRGKEEMDLLQYAMVGGLPKDQLPPEQLIKFEQWFAKLPEFKQKLFEKPSLENILNAHANELYETAFSIYKEKQLGELNDDDTKLIIKTTFQCLTKIDESRAVRNRMTLQEITDIIQQNNIKKQHVGRVLDIFREQGNTFLRPFITDDPESKKTSGNTVLDITHESLIRNWQLLTEWANEEHDNWNNWHDFNKQLQRWVGNNKAKGFLLPIGPLTFFESWFKKCKPNKYWLARYDESEVSHEEKLERAGTILQDAHEFLKKSSRRLFFSKTVLKYGVNRLLVFASLAVLLITCTSYFFDFRRKQNSYIINGIEETSVSNLRSPMIDLKSKAEFLIYNETIHPGSLINDLNGMNSDTMAFDLACEVFIRAENMPEHLSKKEPVNFLVAPVLKYLDSVISVIYVNKSYAEKSRFVYLPRLNAYLNLLAYMKSYEADGNVESLIEKNTEKLNSVLYDLTMDSDGAYQVEVEDYNMAFFLLISLRPEADFQNFINKLSPFEGKKFSNERFNKFYPAEKKIQTGWNQYLSHNGGYQVLACLYAAATQITDDSMFAKINSCVDTLIAYNPDYAKYEFYNFYDIVNTLRNAGKFRNQDITSFLNGATYCTATTKMEFLEHLIMDTYNTKISRWRLRNNEYRNFFYATNFSEPVAREKAWEFYDNELERMGKTQLMEYTTRVTSETGARGIIKYSNSFSGNEYNFYKALLNKKKGCFYQEVYNDVSAAKNCFKNALLYYGKISSEYLNAPREFGFFEGNQPVLVSPKNMFLYPKVVSELLWKHNNMWNRIMFYYSPDKANSTAFFDYMFKLYHPDFYYSDVDGINTLQTFYSINYKVNDSIAKKCIKVIRQIISIHPELKKEVNPYLFQLEEIKTVLDKRDTVMASRLLAQLNMSGIKSSGFIMSSEKWKTGAVHGELINDIVISLSRYGKVKESFSILNLLEKPFEKRNLLIDVVDQLQSDSVPVENSFIYLDSLFRNNDLNIQPKFGIKLIYVLSKIGGNDMNKLAIYLLKDVKEDRKQRAIGFLIKGMCYNENYFIAKANFPEYISSDAEQQLFNLILQAETHKILKENKPGIKHADYFMDDEEKNYYDYESGY